MSLRSCIQAGMLATACLCGPASAQPAPGWTADLAAGYSALSRTTLGDWSAASALLGYRNEAGRMVWGRVEHDRRFGMQDTYFQVGLQNRIAGGTGSLALGSAFGGDFREDVDLRLAWTGPAWRPAQGAGGTDFDLSMRIADYGEGAVTVLAPGLVHYARARDAWLSVAPVFVRGAGGRWEGGLAMRADTALGENWRIRGGISWAPEIDAGRVARTRGFEAGLRRRFGAGREVGGTLTHEDRQDSYARTQLTLSLRQRF